MTEVIGVRFRGGCKEYYFDPHGITVEPNQFVIVETAQGLEYAQCVSGNHEVEDDSVVQPLRPLVRVATENDDRTYAYNKTREKNAFEVCQKKIAERGLDMKLVRVESNFDGSKIIFFFTSDGRVDFRELVRDLAGPASSCGRSACATRRRCSAASASAAGLSAARSFWTTSSPFRSRWPKRRI